MAYRDRGTGARYGRTNRGSGMPYRRARGLYQRLGGEQQRQYVRGFVGGGGLRSAKEGVTGKYKTRDYSKDQECKYLDKKLPWVSVASQGANPATQNYLQWTAYDGGLPASGNMTNSLWYIGQSLVTNQQGTGPSDRIGRKITAKKVEIFGGVNAVCETDTELKTTLLGRLLVIHDKQYNGTPVKSSDLFESEDGNGDLGYGNSPIIGKGANPHMVALPNMANTNRFKILRDHHFTWQYGQPQQVINIAGTENSKVTINSQFLLDIELDKMDIENSSAGFDLEGIKSNNILLAVCFESLGRPGVDGAGTSATGPSMGGHEYQIQMWGNSRLHYLDS